MVSPCFGGLDGVPFWCMALRKVTEWKEDRLIVKEKGQRQGDGVGQVRLRQQRLKTSCSPKTQSPPTRSSDRRLTCLVFAQNAFFLPDLLRLATIAKPDALLATSPH